MYEMQQFGMDSGDLNFKNREIQENWKSSSKMTFAPMEFHNFLFFHLEWSYEHPGTGGKNAHQNSWSQFAYGSFLENTRQQTSLAEVPQQET